MTAAISWQDDRAHDIVADMANESDRIFNITVTPFSAHFGGAKYLHFTKNDPILKKKVLASSTADDVAQLALKLGYEFSGDELLRFSGKKVGKVTVKKNDVPGEYS